MIQGNSLVVLLCDALAHWILVILVGCNATKIEMYG